MPNLLSYNLWFNIRPGLLTQPFFNIFLAIVVLLIVSSLVLKIIKNRNNKNLYFKFWGNAYFFSLTNAIIGFIYLFFCYEMIPLLSARFWLLIWLLEIVIWIVFLIKMLIVIPRRKIEIEKELQFKKYLP
jgi:hypothetical protein